MALTFNTIDGEPQVIPVWENLKAGNGAGEEIVEIMDKGTADERRHISNIHRPEILVYLPEKDKANGTSVLICPGGGYEIVSVDSEGVEIAKWLNLLGVAGFVLKYRLKEYGYPVPQQDAVRAMKIVRSKAGEFGIDPDRIGVMGFSAGGHLASCVGVLGENESIGGIKNDAIDEVSARPGFMVLVYPVISMDDKITNSGSKINLIGEEPGKELVELLSTNKQITNTTPPAFIVHADDDMAVPSRNSVLFHDALEDAGVEAELHTYEEGGHGFGMRAQKGMAAADWPGRCEAWMKRRGLLDGKQ